MAQKRRRARKAATPRSRRWLALAAGLAAFAAALYLLAGERDPAPGEIGAASRAQLERVLEREDGGLRP